MNQTQQLAQNLAVIPHFHIHWTEKKRLDWERFDDPKAAVERANELVCPNETFTIEECSGKCF